VETVAPAAARDRPRHGELLAPTQRHYGLVRYLETLHATFEARPGWRVLQPPAAIARCFDKRGVHADLEAAGVSVADALTPVTDVEALDAAMVTAGFQRTFVKHRYASSASGLGIYHRAHGSLQSTLRQQHGGRYNSLRVQRYDGEHARGVLRWLLAEGAHVERMHPKARLDGAVFDLRVLVIDGTPAFTVVRQSRHAITNLHLGGWRGDLDALKRRLGSEVKARIDATAVRAAAVFGLFHTGVDVLVEPDLETVRVLEVNAFGDLLPGLTRRGLDVYEWQIERVLQSSRGSTRSGSCL
jgi:hypothetical protein